MSRELATYIVSELGRFDKQVCNRIRNSVEDVAAVGRLAALTTPPLSTKMLDAFLNRNHINSERRSTEPSPAYQGPKAVIPEIILTVKVIGATGILHAKAWRTQSQPYSTPRASPDRFDGRAAIMQSTHSVGEQSAAWSPPNLRKVRTSGSAMNGHSSREVKYR